jgi:ribosomal protein L37AE/L43A
MTKQTTENKCFWCEKNRVEKRNKDVGVCENCLNKRKEKLNLNRDLEIENEIYKRGSF